MWTSAWFGNEMSAEEYGDLAPGGALRRRPGRPLFAAQAVTDNDYFHWELEFPEVFFDRFGRMVEEEAGFDAVVGNPPYG